MKRKQQRRYDNTTRACSWEDYPSIKYNIWYNTISSYFFQIFCSTLILLPLLQQRQQPQQQQRKGKLNNDVNIYVEAITSIIGQQQHKQQQQQRGNRRFSTTTVQNEHLNHNNYIDLSYQYDLSISSILLKIEEQFSQQQQQQQMQNKYDSKKTHNGEPMAIPITTLDVSDLSLGDYGFKKIVDAILAPIMEQHLTTKLCLYARMNSITPYSVLYLFDKLLTIPKSSEMMIGTNANTTIAFDSNDGTVTNQNIDNDDKSNIRISNNILTSPVSHSRIVQRIIKLDLSQNDLSSRSSSSNNNHNYYNDVVDRHNDDIEIMSESSTIDDLSTFNNKFRTKLEQLIANNIICPSELVLDRCCINPPLCRSIGIGLITRYETFLHNKQQQQQQQQQRKRSCSVNDTEKVDDSNNNSNNNNNRTDIVETDNDTIDNFHTQLEDETPPRLLTLSLCGNTNIGDAGTAALAASVRHILASIYDNNNNNDDDGNRDRMEKKYLWNSNEIFHKLDLSACNVGDLGIQALALAFDECSSSSDTNGNTNTFVRNIDLSYNKITDQGIITLAGTLENLQFHNKDNDNNYSDCFFCLDISGNHGITDIGFTALLRAIQKGTINELVVRSCSITADGTETLGKVLRDYILHGQQKNTATDTTEAIPTLTIDLSGNALGVLRGKKATAKQQSKKNDDLASKATSYVSSGMSFLQKAGISLPGSTSPSTLESDDEHEDSNDKKNRRGGNKDVHDDEDGDDDDVDPSKGRCGLKSLSNAFTQILRQQQQQQQHDASKEARHSRPCRVRIGLRHTFCDIAGADALAYMLVYSKENMNGNVQIEFDLSLNPILEDSMVDALHGQNDEILYEMSYRHERAMNALRESRRRSMEIARLAKARSEAQSVLDDFKMSSTGPIQGSRRRTLPAYRHSIEDYDDTNEDLVTEMYNDIDDEDEEEY